jgi:DNA polymerase
MDSVAEFWTDKAHLDWQVELGADEAILDTPVNRYEVPATLPKAVPSAAPDTKLATAATMVQVAAPKIDTVGIATGFAEKANDLEALRVAIQDFQHCDLKRGARNMVFSDGNPAARVMIIGESPDRDEDKEGRPFVGPTGQLFDKMFEAIGLSRQAEAADASIYVTTILPWRTPQDKEPNVSDIAMMLPFLKRHVALVKPTMLVLMGNLACQTVLGRKGITRLRGDWTTGFNTPVLPMLHPADLLRNPVSKREAWHDLLLLKSKLKSAE